MTKSIRTLAVAALVSLATVPSMRADRMGCIPHPQVVAAPTLTALQVIQYTVLAYLGA